MTPSTTHTLPPGVTLRGPAVDGAEEILTTAALALVADLTRRLRDTLRRCLDARQALQARLDQGEQLDFLPDTADLRAADWVAAPLPAPLLRRAVEITGPVDRKMIINALNSGADTFMADFEDSNAPTWDNCLQGQRNLRDAIRGTISYTHPDTFALYRLNPSTATLLVRPRGWHLTEHHLLIDDLPAPAALVDFGLYLTHNAHALLDKGAGPWFYLPKLEHHLEARLWNDAFLLAQQALGLPVGTIKATVLIETLPAAFQMDEILYELRDHAAGLNCGRWDYIFSTIKKRRLDPHALMPDRGQITMTQPCMAAYTRLVIKTCHRRGVLAIGGMAAQIPIKGDEAANAAALDKVRRDKLREASDGHDGTWVAHPGLVPIARAAFAEHMTGPNQLDRLREDVHVTAQDLLRVPEGTRTLAGLRLNLRVGVQYIAAWLRGQGCVPIDHLMEDAATAEISRAQVWQWLHHRATLDDGATVTPALIQTLLDQELAALPHDPLLSDARTLFEAVATAPDFIDFLTEPAYARLLTREA